MWQDRQCHILEGDGRTMEQFEIIGAISFHKRSDHFCIKLGIVRSCDTVFQLFFCKIRKIKLHNLIGNFTICHMRQLFQ